jgi:hypothetical protein
MADRVVEEIISRMKETRPLLGRAILQQNEGLRTLCLNVDNPRAFFTDVYQGLDSAFQGLAIGQYTRYREYFVQNLTRGKLESEILPQFTNRQLLTLLTDWNDTLQRTVTHHSGSEETNGLAALEQFGIDISKFSKPPTRDELVMGVLHLKEMMDFQGAAGQTLMHAHYPDFNLIIREGATTDAPQEDLQTLSVRYFEDSLALGQVLLVSPTDGHDAVPSIDDLGIYDDPQHQDDPQTSIAASTQQLIQGHRDRYQEILDMVPTETAPCKLGELSLQGEENPLADQDRELPQGMTYGWENEGVLTTHLPWQVVRHTLPILIEQRTGVRGHMAMDDSILTTEAEDPVPGQLPIEFVADARSFNQQAIDDTLAVVRELDALGVRGNRTTSPIHTHWSVDGHPLRTEEVIESAPRVDQAYAAIRQTVPSQRLEVEYVHPYSEEGMHVAQIISHSTPPPNIAERLVRHVVARAAQAIGHLRGDENLQQNWQAFYSLNPSWWPGGNNATQYGHDLGLPPQHILELAAKAARGELTPMDARELIQGDPKLRKADEGLTSTWIDKAWFNTATGQARVPIELPNGHHVVQGGTQEFRMTAFDAQHEGSEDGPLVPPRYDLQAIEDAVRFSAQFAHRARTPGASLALQTPDERQQATSIPDQIIAQSGAESQIQI